MGQVCCVPQRRQSKQIAKIKAEARSATAVRPEPPMLPAPLQTTDGNADRVPTGRTPDQDREPTTPPEAQEGHADPAPEMTQRQAQPQALLEVQSPKEEVLSPTPHVSGMRFPFLYQASDGSTCGSSIDDTLPGGSRSAKDARASVSSVETVVARSFKIEDSDDTEDTGTVRYSIASMSPDIFYIAPSSPEASGEVTPQATPAVRVTLASPSLITLQPHSIRPSIDHSLLQAGQDAESLWNRATASLPLLPQRPSPSNSSLDVTSDILSTYVCEARVGDASRR